MKTLKEIIRGWNKISREDIHYSSQYGYYSIEGKALNDFERLIQSYASHVSQEKDKELEEQKIYIDNINHSLKTRLEENEQLQERISDLEGRLNSLRGIEAWINDRKMKELFQRQMLTN